MQQEIVLGLVYPQEMYKDGLYRCVHSNDEQRTWMKQGWSLEMEEGKERKDYKVYHHEAVKADEPKRGPGRPAKVS